MGIFPANRVRNMPLPASSTRASHVYSIIWLKLLWSQFLERYGADPTIKCSEGLDRFRSATLGVMSGQDSALHQLAGYMGVKVPVFKDGLANDWRQIALSELGTVNSDSVHGTQSGVSDTKEGLELQLRALTFDLKRGSKCSILIDLQDESQGQQASESVKLSFVVDKHGQIPASAIKSPLRFVDLDRTTIKPSVSLVFKLYVESAIDEQQKQTAPVYKLVAWAGFLLADGLKGITKPTVSNITLVPFHPSHIGDKSQFTTKRYTKLRQANHARHHSLAYKLGWESGVTEGAILTNHMGQILRSPPLLTSKLYVTLVSGWFEKGKKTSEKNVELRVYVVDAEDRAQELILDGAGRTPRYLSGVTRHSNTPEWQETFTVCASDALFETCSLKLECRHVSSSEHKNCLTWVTYLPLCAPGGHVTPNALYTLRLLPRGSYLNRDLWEEEVALKEEHRQVQRVVVRTQLDSNTLTDSPAIYRIRCWENHSKELKQILKELNSTDFSKCVNHAQSIFKSILEIIDSCVDGEIISSAMSVLFSFSRFWNSHNELRERLLEALSRTNFVSGLIKLVSWMKYATQDKKRPEFRQTLKSLSLLLTVMSKSLSRIRRSGIMSGQETDRYKAVLANMIVQITHLDVENNVIVSSQVIRAMPESLTVLHKDGIISTNEVTFHLITLLKSDIMTVLKQSQSNRVSFIEHLNFLISSEFLLDNELQSRYLKDLNKALALSDDYTLNEVTKMGILLAKLCERSKISILQRPDYLDEITSLIQNYLERIKGFDSKDKQVKLAFLSLTSVFVDFCVEAPDKESVSCRFKSVTQSVRAILEKRQSTTDSKTGNQVQPVKDERESVLQGYKLDIVSKILSYSVGMSALETDVLYIAASVLGESLRGIDKESAAKVAIFSRLQLLHNSVSGRVKKRVDELCENGTLHHSLLNPVVRILSPNYPDLIKFADNYLSRCPGGLKQLLSALHKNADKITGLTRDPQFDYKSEKTALIVKQTEQLVAVREVDSNTKTFHIAAVQTLITLLRFYKKQRCWEQFAEVADLYREVLLRSESYLEAAELAVLTNTAQPGQSGDLLTAAEYYTEAGLWNRALQVLRSVEIEIREGVREEVQTKDSYRKLADVAGKCSALYTNLAEKPSIPFHYFLVGLYGSEVRSCLRDKLFVFRGQPLESLMEFSKRLMLHFPGYQQINSAKPPTEEQSAKYLKSFQVTKLHPVLSEVRSDSNIRTHNKFTFEVCSVKDKTITDELLRMSYERYSFETQMRLPSYVPFSEVSRQEIRVLQPLEMAIEQVEKKTEDLREEARKLGSGEGNISHFQMMLNGTIDAAVNGGTNKMRETFLSGEYERGQPEEGPGCRGLEEQIARQREVVGQCLLVHEEHCPPELRALHEKMVRQHENKPLEEPVTALPLELASQHHQKGVILSEISRRSSKLKKSQKIKRMTSVFFESHQTEIELKDSLSPIIAENPIVEEPKELAEEKLDDIEKFESIYSKLCTQLNQDFNMHGLPRYSVGRRETMTSRTRPTSNMSHRYSSRKEISKTPPEGIYSVLEINSELIEEDLPPVLPPKSKKEEPVYEPVPALPGKQKTGQSLPALPCKVRTEVTCDLAKETTEDIAPATTSHRYSKSEKSSPVSSGDEVKKNPRRLVRCHTIGDPSNLKPLQFTGSHSEPTALSVDSLKLDLKALATDFKLSSEAESKKITRGDFGENKKPPSLNELKQTRSSD